MQSEKRAGPTGRERRAAGSPFPTSAAGALAPPGPGHRALRVRRSRFVLYTTPNGGQAAHTLAGWTVGDLDAEMTELRGRGVTFEEYDLPGLKTVDGVAEGAGMRGA